MKTQFQWRLMRAARYAVTKTQFQWRLTALSGFDPQIFRYRGVAAR